jgi:DNA-binding CsgD family transcriptional regulator
VSHVKVAMSRASERQHSTNSLERFHKQNKRRTPRLESLALSVFALCTQVVAPEHGAGTVVAVPARGRGAERVREMDAIRVEPEAPGARARLTPREVEVLRTLVSEPDASLSHLGKRLGIHVKTVRTHLAHVRAKLGCSTTLSAVLQAARRGYFPDSWLRPQAERPFLVTDAETPMPSSGGRG